MVTTVVYLGFLAFLFPAAPEEASLTLVDRCIRDIEAELKNTLPDERRLEALNLNVLEAAKTLKPSEFGNYVKMMAAKDLTFVLLLLNGPQCFFDTVENQGFSRDQRRAYNIAIVKKLQSSPIFLKKFSEFFRWTDGFRIPDRLDSFPESSQDSFAAEVVSTVQHVKKETAISCDHAEILCYGDLLGYSRFSECRDTASFRRQADDFLEYLDANDFTTTTGRRWTPNVKTGTLGSANSGPSLPKLVRPTKPFSKPSDQIDRLLLFAPRMILRDSGFRSPRGEMTIKN